jgi:hypothetical protein
VHRPSTTCAVIDARGKRVRVDVVETNGQALIEFLKLQPGTLRPSSVSLIKATKIICKYDKLQNPSHARW